MPSIQPAQQGQTQNKGTYIMTDTSTWLDQNSGGSGYPAVQFPAVGALVRGVISSTPRIVTVQNDKGQDEERLVVELKAIDGCTASTKEGSIEAGADVTLWVKPGFMTSAIKEAVREAGAKGLAEGDTLVVRFKEQKDTGKIQPAKVYDAKYVAAKPTVSVDELI